MEREVRLSDAPRAAPRLSLFLSFPNTAVFEMSFSCAVISFRLGNP